MEAFRLQKMTKVQVDEVRNGRPPQLDKRLSVAYHMVPTCSLCADIGADHGRLSAVLLYQGRVKHVLVSDISAKALQKAKDRLQSMRLESRATFVVADGIAAVKAIKHEVPQCICILGMGGETIRNMLSKGRSLLSDAVLVLGAQTELPLLREEIVAVGYRIRQEVFTEVAGRSYIVMKATPQQVNEPPYTEQELLMGPCLLRERSIQWLCWVEKRIRAMRISEEAMRASGHPKDVLRLKNVQRDLELMEKVFAENSQGDDWEQRKHDAAGGGLDGNDNPEGL